MMLVLWWKAVNLRARLWLVHALQRKKFEVILLIEPRTLKILKWEIGPSSKRERIDGKLDMSVLLFPRLGLVIEDLQIPIADLQKVDMASDDVIVEVKFEPAVPVVGDIRARKVHGDFDGNGGRVIEEHKALKRLMPFFVFGCRGQDKSRKPRCIVFFPHDGSRELRGKFGGAMFGCLKHAMREIVTDRLKVIFCGSEVAMARDPEQKFEFRSMELETVDLLMTQDKAAHHRIWVKKRSSYCA